jgi:hypothetical protein
MAVDPATVPIICSNERRLIAALLVSLMISPLEAFVFYNSISPIGCFEHPALQYNQPGYGAAHCQSPDRGAHYNEEIGPMPDAHAHLISRTSYSGTAS